MGARYACETYVCIWCEPGLIKPHTFNVCVIFTHSLRSVCFVAREHFYLVYTFECGDSKGLHSAERSFASGGGSSDNAIKFANLYALSVILCVFGTVCIPIECVWLVLSLSLLCIGLNAIVAHWSYLINILRYVRHHVENGWHRHTDIIRSVMKRGQKYKKKTIANRNV